MKGIRSELTDTAGRRRLRRATSGVLTLVTMVAAGAAGRGRAAPAPAAVAGGDGVRPAAATDVLAEVRSARGSVVLVNVWATWCVPCREELPDLLRLRREFGGRGLRLVLVSADLSDQRAAAAAFLRSQGVDFPTLAKAQGDQEFIEGLDRRWSGALPATLLFDRSGAEVAFWEGASSYAQLAKRVKPLLGTP